MILFFPDWVFQPGLHGTGQQRAVEDSAIAYVTFFPTRRRHPYRKPSTEIYAGFDKQNICTTFKALVFLESVQ